MPLSTDESNQGALRHAILNLVRHRGTGKTICPSEAARLVSSGHWRALMNPVRAEAVGLAQAGLVVLTQNGKSVDLLDFKGVYRIGLPPKEKLNGKSS